MLVRVLYPNVVSSRLARTINHARKDHYSTDNNREASSLTSESGLTFIEAKSTVGFSLAIFKKARDSCAPMNRITPSIFKIEPSHPEVRIYAILCSLAGARSSFYACALVSAYGSMYLVYRK